MIGIWGARIDNGGLAWQTLALSKMLNPRKILAIDSSSFNPGTQQDYERFEDFDTTIITRFPTNIDAAQFLKTGVSHVFVCETAYNMNFFNQAAFKRVKVFLQPNAEFADHLTQRRHPLPYMFILPSTWHMDKYQERYRNVMLLPPPTDEKQFEEVRNVNMERTIKKLKILFINGKQAHLDRNGLKSVLEAVNLTKGDFTLTVRSQYDIEEEIKDSRVIVEIGNIDKQEDMYKDFDLMLFPRRYGGLSLPLNEALISGLPVIMTNISPNDYLLPKHWLINSSIIGQFITRIPIDVYAADVDDLANKIDEFCNMSNEERLIEKQRAFNIGKENFSFEILKPQYESLLV
jgi:glycosyltransferase involved in cell wall biosynthesis